MNKTPTRDADGVDLIAYGRPIDHRRQPPIHPAVPPTLTLFPPKSLPPAPNVLVTTQPIPTEH